MIVKTMLKTWEVSEKMMNEIGKNPTESLKNVLTNFINISSFTHMTISRNEIATLWNNH